MIYAGALDIAVGPRWYSTYEMACNWVKMKIEGEALHAVPYGGVSEAEVAMLRNTGTVTPEESAHLIQTVLRDNEIAVLEEVTALVKAGKNPRRILDVLQLAVAQTVLETHTPENFNMPHHCYEYHNTLAWFWDNFDHPRRLRLLFVAACFANRVAGNQIGLGDVHPEEFTTADAGGLSQAQVLDRVDTAICSLNGPDSVAWTQAYCDNFSDRAPLVSRIALAATKLGNDPHNQEIAQCMLMDFGTNQQPNRDRLLLCAAYHTAMHRKYGDPLEPAKRFGRAFGMARTGGLMSLSIKADRSGVSPVLRGRGVRHRHHATAEPGTGGRDRSGMDQYGVLVFHDQHFTDETQLAFSRNFGELETATGELTFGQKRRMESGDVNDISNLESGRRVRAVNDRKRLFSLGNRMWHSDSSFKEVPAKFSLLSARSIPSAGGNTEFADMRAAYDALDGNRSECEDLVCEHSQIYSARDPGLYRVHRPGTPR